jgi:adenylate cyclase class IV
MMVMSMSNIEVEIRGPLAKKDYESLKAFLETKGKFVKKGNRLSIMYFRDNIPKKSIDIKDEKVDLRLRITNKKPELVLKYGIWEGSDARKEFNFPVKIEHFMEWIDFLKCLDWSLTVVYANTLASYEYKGIEFTVVEIKDFGYTYEAEILAKDDAEAKTAKKIIKEVCTELNLKEYKKGEFESQCDSINNTKSLQYDFKSIDPKVLLKRFKDFF